MKKGKSMENLAMVFIVGFLLGVVVSSLSERVKSAKSDISNKAKKTLPEMSVEELTELLNTNIENQDFERCC